MIALGVGAFLYAASTASNQPAGLSAVVPVSQTPATLPAVDASGQSSQDPQISAATLPADAPVRGSNPMARKITSTIPAWLGLPALLLGFLSLNPSYRKHAMHAAVIIGLLGVLGGLGMGLPSGIKWLLGTEPARPLATVVQLLMGSFSLVFVVLCVQSFIAARKARLAQ
jgi:hypothetical protein